MSITVLIPYCNMGQPENLEGCLKSLRDQTRPPDAIIVMDDSPDADKPMVKQICESNVSIFLDMPFRNYVPQWAQKFNGAFPFVKTDMIMLCCANWKLGPEWLQEVESNLKLIGKKNMIAGDSARCQSIHGGPPASIPWWETAAPLFEVFDYNLVDEGFLNLLWTEDWQPWDEEFDQVGGWHAVIEWGYRFIYLYNNHLWIRRHLTAVHQPIPPDGIREKLGQNEFLQQTAMSSYMLNAKIGGWSIYGSVWLLNQMTARATGLVGRNGARRITLGELWNI